MPVCCRYTINGKALSARCDTLDDVLAHLQDGPAEECHPDIKVRPTVLVPVSNPTMDSYLSVGATVPEIAATKLVNHIDL